MALNVTVPESKEPCSISKLKGKHRSWQYPVAIIVAYSNIYLYRRVLLDLQETQILWGLKQSHCATTGSSHCEIMKSVEYELVPWILTAWAAWRYSPIVMGLWHYWRTGYCPADCNINTFSFRYKSARCVHFLTLSLPSAISIQD